MSGNWIKMGVGLRTHPKVVRMASALKADRLRVIGGLHAVWSIFDAHTDDGFLEGYDARTIDEDLAWRGFAKAMQDVGWLKIDGDGAHVPRYSEHNGSTAKRRAQETSRKGSARKKSASKAPESPQEGGNESGQVSASDADKVRNREEKRREEVLNTPPQEERGERLGAPAPLLLPAHWAPSADDVEWAEQERPDLKGDPLTAMTLKFRKHHGEKKSRRFDWSESWREWVTREGKAQPPPGIETKADKRAKWASELTGKDHGQRTIDGTAERVG